MSIACESLNVAEFFNNVSKSYDPWFQKDIYYLQMLQKIVETLKKYDSSTIIELGCGSGNLTLLLAEQFPASSIIAVDVSDELLNIARKKCHRNTNVEFVNEDMLSFMANPNESASVVGNLSLHHLTGEEKEMLVRNISKIIGIDNVFVIGDVFIEAENSPEREEAVLDIFHARCSYYLKTTGLDRAIFELEHVPMILRKEQEHLVSEDFWWNCTKYVGLHSVESTVVGPEILGNKVLEMRK